MTMSLVFLIAVFSALTLLIVLLLVCVLRRRITGERRDARGDAPDASAPVVKKEE